MNKHSVFRMFWPGFLAVALLTMSCARGPSVNLSGGAEQVQFTISDPALKNPINLIGTDSGTFYYQTETGKHWITGKPQNVQQNNGSFQGTWQVENRTITIDFQPTQNPIDQFGGKALTFNLEAQPNTDILGWGFSLDAERGEYFTGLFERTVDGPQSNSWAQGITAAMNLHGQAVDMFIKPTLSLYNPFYLSDRGYGLFVKGTWPGRYDFGKADPKRVQVYFEGPSFESTLYIADTPATIVKAHSLQSGPTIVPPKWAFRPWRWRDEHVNRKTYYDGTPVNAPYNSEVVEDVLMMKALDIPCSLYWVDRPWATGPAGYNDFEWDINRFPHPEQMIKWLNQNGMQFMLWIAPWVNGNMAKEAIAKGYNVSGQTDGATDRPLVDFTNPDARKWWQQGLKKVLDQGVVGFKMDRSEELMPSDRDHRMANGETTREAHNDYPVEYLKAAYDIARQVHNEFVMMPRAGYTGSAQYGAFWGGDIGSPPQGLRTALIAVERSAVMGYPIWGSDTGGYWHGQLDREVLARWLAFSCFTPIMEVGPTENRGLWDVHWEPHYDSQILAIWRFYATLHDSLADYTYAAAQTAHNTGMPVVRPLFLEYSGQAQAWQDWQTYKFGPDILVSPIWEKGTTQKTLYLPGGETWVNAWDPSQEYQGGKQVTIQTPLNRIPIFYRKGANVPLSNLPELYQQSLNITKNQPDMKTLEQKAFGN